MSVEIIHAVYQRHIFKNMIWSQFENRICVFLIYLKDFWDMAHMIWLIWVFILMLSAYRCLSSTGLTGTAFAKTARMLVAIFENFILSFSFKFVLISQFDFCGNFDHSKEFIFWLYINNWNDSCHLEVLLKLKSNV